MKLLLWIEVQSMPSAMEHIIQMSTTELLAAVYVLNPTFRDIFAHFGQYSCDFRYDIRCELRIIQQLHVSPKKKSIGAKTHEHAGQLTGPFLENTLLCL